VNVGASAAIHGRCSLLATVARSRPMRRLRLFLAVGLLGVFSPRVSRAEADGGAQAKELFARARHLRVQGDCTNAVSVFREAYQVYPSGLGSLRNIAECEESLGHFALARRTWLDLQQALTAKPDPKYAGWDDDSVRGVARLTSRLARLTVDVVAAPSSSEPDEGFEVTLDGEPLAASLLGTQLERDPGRCVVRFLPRTAGSAQEQVVELAEREIARVVFRLHATASPESARIDSSATAAQPGSPNAPTEHKAAQATSTAGWIALGLAGASLVGAAAALVVRQSAHDDLMRACPSGSCDPSLAPTVRPIEDRGHTASTLAGVLGTLGVLGVVGGVVLLVWSPPPSTSGALTVLISPMGVSAMERF
jgi:hypothetical protein